MFTRQAVRREMYSGSKGGVGNRIACSPSLEYAAEELVMFARVPPFTVILLTTKNSAVKTGVARSTNP